MADKYVLSVAPERGAGAGEPSVTITVDVSGGRPLATEMNVRAGKGGSLDLSSLPLVEVLMRALSGDEAPRARRTGTRRSTAAVAAGEAAEVSRPASRRRATRAKAAETRSRKASSAAAGGRAYRRMPEPDEVVAAFQEVGTVNGLAEYYGVPQHTVKGWARRLRQMGYELAR
jgi:hypothetical protein